MYFLNQFLICLSVMFATLDCMEKITKEDDSSMGRFTPTPPADYYYISTSNPLASEVLNGKQGVVTEKGQIAILKPEKHPSPEAFKETCTHYNITIIDQPTDGSTVASCYVGSKVAGAEPYTPKIITTFAQNPDCYCSKILFSLTIDSCLTKESATTNNQAAIVNGNIDITNIPPQMPIYYFPYQNDNFIVLAPIVYSTNGDNRDRCKLYYYTPEGKFKIKDSLDKDMMVRNIFDESKAKDKYGTNNEEKLKFIFKKIYANQRTDEGVSCPTLTNLEYSLHIDDINVINEKPDPKTGLNIIIVETLSRLIIKQQKTSNNVADFLFTIYCLYKQTVEFKENSISSDHKYSLALLQIEQDNRSFFTGPIYFTKKTHGNEIRKIQCMTGPDKDTHNNVGRNTSDLDIITMTDIVNYFQQSPEKKAQRESIVLQRQKPFLYLSLPVPSENNCELPLQIKTLFESLIKNINALSTNNSLDADAPAEISNATLKNVHLLEGVYAELYTNAAKTVESRLSKAVETEIGNLLTAVDAIIKTQSQKIEECKDQSVVTKAEFKHLQGQLQSAKEDVIKSFTATCKGLTQELTNLFLQTLQSQIEEYRNDLENINKTLQAPLKILKTDLENLKPDLIERNEQLKKSIAESEALFTKFEKLVNENKTNFDKMAKEQIENIQTQLNKQLTNALTTQTETFSDKIQALKIETDKQIQDRSQTTDALLKEHTGTVQALKKEKDEQIEKLNTEFRQSIATLTTETNAQIQTLKTDLYEKIQQLTTENKNLQDQIKQLQDNNKSTVSSFLLKQMWQIALTVCVVFLMNNFNTILAYKI